MIGWLRLIAFLSLGVCATGHAIAHPHVWVTMNTAVVFAPDGSLTGVQHVWAFDDMYSAFAIRGVAHKTPGVFTREELAPLADFNMSSLKEYKYFTYAKSEGKKISFGDAVDYWNEYHDGIVTLHFTLPFKTPVKTPRTVQIQVYDPTIFVDFEFAKGEPVTLVGAPPHCKPVVDRPREITLADSQRLGEAFFNSLTSASDFGAQFANTILVLCP